LVGLFYFWLIAFIELIRLAFFSDIQMSQNWRTNYLLPYRGCLNVHEKNMENNFQTKNQLLLLLLLTVIQCKQKYTRTRSALPCNGTIVDVK
jgi:hypothetical protein